MHTLAHGVDIVETLRIAQLLRDHEERFLDRCFTGAERAYCQGTRREVEHLAVRFAAKEAVFKALGTGLTGGITWKDVEVARDVHGCPNLRLSGRAAQIAAAAHISRWIVSLSHTDSYAIASAIGLGEPR